MCPTSFPQKSIMSIIAVKSNCSMGLKKPYCKVYSKTGRAKSEAQAHTTGNQYLGWWLQSQFPLFHYLPSFSESSKCSFLFWYIFDRCHCSDICQIWMRFKESDRYFYKIEIFLSRDITKQSFSAPTHDPDRQDKGCAYTLCICVCAILINLHMAWNILLNYEYFHKSHCN